MGDSEIISLFQSTWNNEIDFPEMFLFYNNVKNIFWIMYLLDLTMGFHVVFIFMLSRQAQIGEK